MTNPETAIANDAPDGATPPSRRKTAQAPGEKTFISDERRVEDALEDDEVREALRAAHEAEQPGKGGHRA